SPLGDVVNMNIEPVDTLTEQSISGNSSRIYRYDNGISRIVLLVTAHTNLTILNIYQKSANGGVESIPILNVKESYYVEFFMEESRTYYIEIYNTTKSALSTRVRVGAVSREVNATTAKGTSLDLAANDNYRYYRFTPKNDGDYQFNFENDLDEDFDMLFCCFDKDKNTIPYSQYTDGYLIMQNLKANNTYYIGVISNKAMTVIPKFTKTTPTFQWKYNDGTTWKNVVNQEFNLPRGKTYEFGLWINGVMAKNYDVRFDSELNRYFKRNSNYKCGIDISYDVPDSLSFEIYAKPIEHTGTSYDNYIRVRARFDASEMTFQTFNYTNTAEVIVNMPVSVSGWYASITGKNRDNQTVTIAPDAPFDGTTWDVYTYLKNNNAIGQWTVKIKSVIISQATGGTRSVPINKTTELGATYSYKASSNGKTVYHIGNALQFYNIRYDMSCGRILDNNISLAEYPNWEPITTLTCDINGNGNTISNLKIDIKSYNNVDFYGLVGANNATISNLTLKDFKVYLGYEENPTVSKFAGVFAGQNNGIIQHCYAVGSIYGWRDLTNIGGFAGRNYGQILNCEYGKLGSSRSYVYSWADAGGICGHNCGTIMDCRTLNTTLQQRLYGTNASIGGIAAYSTAGSFITRCAVEVCSIENVNDAKVKSLKPKMGVIVGHMVEGTITSVGQNNVTCSTGNVDSKSTTYCFNGSWPFYGKLENCTVDGNGGQWGP
ncbi:MAG: hypothetical protein HDT36_02750, partial [Clostridiales bacterium]|nr:hypothetical protein [Clostridiales bacterium]